MYTFLMLLDRPMFYVCIPNLLTYYPCAFAIIYSFMSSNIRLVYCIYVLCTCDPNQTRIYIFTSMLLHNSPQPYTHISLTYYSFIHPNPSSPLSNNKRWLQRNQCVPLAREGIKGKRNSCLIIQRMMDGWMDGLVYAVPCQGSRSRERKSSQLPLFSTFDSFPPLVVFPVSLVM